MSTPRSTEARISRALAAVKAHGLPVACVEVRPDGTVLVLTTPPAQPALGEDALCDQAFGVVRG